MGAVKPTTILFVLLVGLSLSARADSECAPLLASSSQSRELSTEQKFRAYMVDLLEGGELGFDVFADFSKNLNEGILANPVTEKLALLNWELHFHRSLLQEYVDSGELDVEELSVWALERLEKIEGDRSGQETVSEEIKEIADSDVTSPAFWEQVTDRYLRYIPVGEKISGTGGMAAIHFAAQHAPPETLKKFVDIHRKDLNVNAQDNNGRTPLMYAAAWNGNTDAINTLVKFGAAVNVQDSYGKTPLMYTAQSGNPENAVNVLVDASADVNAQDRYGKTPMMYTAQSEKPEIITALVNAGADINAQDNYGLTPLFYVAWSRSPDTITALVNAGADVNAQSNRGLTPLMYAANSGNLDAVNTLKKAGAKK